MYFSGLWLEVLLYFFWTIFLYPSQVSVALQVPLRPLTNIVTSKQQQQRQTNTQARARAHTHTYTHTHAHTHTHSQSYTHSHTHTHTHTHTQKKSDFFIALKWWCLAGGPDNTEEDLLVALKKLPADVHHNPTHYRGDYVAFANPTVQQT